MKSNEFVTYVLEDQLGNVPGMTSRAMFGGFGVYREGTIVGIIVDDELYLKVDETNQKEYEQMGSEPFVFTAKDKKPMSMSYWKVPGDVLEDREALERLVDSSYEINLKRAVEKGMKKQKKKK